MDNCFIAILFYYFIFLKLNVYFENFEKRLSFTRHLKLPLRHMHVPQRQF